MQRCVIYARVSTKEQADEGYSIPAQLKACREFCTRNGLSPVAEFVEASSGSRAGREQFASMCDFFTEHPEARIVVAHKLDRLTRNFGDMIRIDELGVKARYVTSDFPDGPAGELARDVNLAVAKHFSNNLRQEVKKGMEEKVAQGGWPHFAPLGYLNDKNTRSLVVDPVGASFVRHAFARYATGLVSLADLRDELYSMGLRSKTGNKVGVSAVDKMLKNPIYAGQLRYKGVVYPGSHEPLVSLALFQAVQDAFAPNRRNNQAKKRSYILRGFLTCSECGAKITAGTHKGHVYYRCTHGKGACSQRSYVREERLMREVAEVLARIELDTEIMEALVEEARILERQGAASWVDECDSLNQQIATVSRRLDALLNTLLDGVISQEIYSAKSAELEEQRWSLERRRDLLSKPPADLSGQVEALLQTAATARIDFEAASDELKREVLSEVLCNLTVEGGHIGSYQYKDPFGVLVKDSSGALSQSWWALEDLNL